MAAAISTARHCNQLEADKRAEQLEHALSSRVGIEQAKGVLVGRDGMTMEEAFGRLRGHARSHRQSLRQLASDVVEKANSTS
jgi:AmiR/NasT family two-component response regulator